jgi:hypothetical protein
MPSWKATLPVGVPEPRCAAATAAVKVTAWPTADGSCDELRLVVVASATVNVWLARADSPPFRLSVWR